MSEEDFLASEKPFQGYLDAFQTKKVGSDYENTSRAPFSPTLRQSLNLDHPISEKSSSLDGQEVLDELKVFGMKPIVSIQKAPPERRKRRPPVKIEKKSFVPHVINVANGTTLSNNKDLLLTNTGKP